MEKLSGELRWPKSDYEVDPLSERGIREFVERYGAQERQEEYNKRHAEKVAREVVNEGAQCVLVSDRTVRSHTIKDTTHDEPGEDSQLRLGDTEADGCAGATGGEEGSPAGDYDGDADE